MASFFKGGDFFSISKNTKLSKSRPPKRQLPPVKRQNTLHGNVTYDQQGDAQKITPPLFSPLSR